MRIMLSFGSWLRCNMILLSLNHISTYNLWVLNLNLRVIEDIIIIIDVLYYFDWLLVLLFWL